MSGLTPRVVTVRRQTDYEALLAHHATHGQARFFLEARGQDIGEVEQVHKRLHDAMAEVASAVPDKWRRATVDRRDLDRFLFEPEDIVVVVGQDGLVANTAKYLNGQPVLGINPLPDRFDGILVPHPPEAARELLPLCAGGDVATERRTMVEAALDDGQVLLALNEIFIGHRSHQSARYRISCPSGEERQSSSGVIVATGTGSTGWARSIHLSRRSGLALPGPTDPELAFFVREAFPSIATGTDVTDGLIGGNTTLDIVSEMNHGGVIFGDGIEDDCIAFAWGQKAALRVADRQLNLVTG